MKNIEKSLDIKGIWYKPSTIDCYTIVLNSKFNEDLYPDLRNCLATCETGAKFSLFSSAAPGRHLGKKVKFEELSVQLQNHIIERLTTDEE